MNGAIRVGWAGNDRQKRTIKARGIDISEEGLGVLAPTPLPAGVLAQVDIGGCGMSAVARVRFCVNTAEGWHTGFEVIKCFPNDPPDFNVE